MKRQLAFPLLFAACSLAHAQSSVTLYGIVDLGITYANSVQTGTVAGKHNGASQIAMADGHSSGLGGSRWGLRGAEDLGGGLKAIFVLENGFFANTGALAQGGAEFGRQSYVGLASSTWGKVTLGRQYDPYIESVQQFAATSAFAGYMGAHASDLDNLANTARINNSIKFTTADYSGFVAGGIYSLGGVAGDATRNQVWALGANYSHGPFAVGLGYLNARDPNVSFYGNTPNKGVATVNNIGSFGSATTPQMVPAYAGYASANSLEIAGVGAKYSWDATTVGLVVTDTRFSRLGSTEAPNPRHYTGNANFVSAELNLRTFVTPALSLGAAFDYIKRNSVNGDGGAKYLQLDLGAIYSLSKRTDLYALSVLQRTSGVDSLGQQAVASISGFTPSATDKQVAARAGIRHKF
ncbi:porin [Paraburkholderia diazotrophica]|uniref:Prepilin-type processing-associated H-X9-DG domain-containing protein n=1 Tax=Paraburkholderia diazotrophica TaxID=667676 RepID=A0A1H7CQG8_9BURK|nr:porin [Paraburkholderia diazotrophica]SEJ91918.1 prepilin-type processing-associated H-X9-DG domain-containing protein [Paraburkholderia diazotrophica]